MPLDDLNLTDDDLFVPDEESDHITNPTGNEKLFTQDGDTNGYLTSKQAGDLGGNVRIDGADTTVGNIESKYDSGSPIELYKTGSLDKKFGLRIRSIESAADDVDDITDSGVYTFDTSTNGTSTSGYTNLPLKLSLVTDITSMESAILEVLVWGTDINPKILQKFSIVLDESTTMNVVSFYRSYFGGEWTQWTESSNVTYNSSQLDVNKYLYDGYYSFNIGANDYSDYSNLPTTMPPGVLIADLYSRLDEVILQVSETDTTSSNDMIQTLIVPYGTTGSPKFATYQRFRAAGTWSAWEIFSGSGSGGGSSYVKIRDGVFTGFGIDGEVAWSLSAGTGTITIDTRNSLRSATIIISPGSDGDGSGNFNLSIVDSSSSFNTWDPSSEGDDEHDMWVPNLRIYDLGPTILNQSKGTDISTKTSGSNGEIAPDIEWGSGIITYKFLGSNDFGSKSKLLISINNI